MSEVFNRIINSVWPMLIVFTVALCVMRFFYIKNNRERFVLYKELSYLFGIIYFLLLFEILTMSEINSTAGMNLAPFSEILRYDIHSKLFKINVIGNVLMIVPFGYIIGVYVKPKKIWPVIITTLITSLTVEFVQLKIGRSFDVDDIMLNLLGGIIGYLLYIGLNAIMKHLPDVFRSEIVYNIISIAVTILFCIYALGYWSVVFR